MRHPNIIFILADDQGAWSLGSAGNKDIITPNLDKMAEKGMRFENFFCASPVCSPARASILTGLLPSAHGVHDWIRSGSIPKALADKVAHAGGRYEDEQDSAIDYLEGFDTYTQQLANSGYNCALCGKWHLGDSLNPKQGFSKWYTIGLGGCLYMQPDIIENGQIEVKDEYVTHLISKKAVQYLEELHNEEKPFYLSVHYTAPHSPWHAEDHPKEYLDLYKDCACHSCPTEALSQNQVNASPYARNEEERLAHIRGYYASITAMDKGIGVLLDKLEELNIAEDTLVIFSGDNGVNMGHHGIWGKGNATFPMNMYDTSVKVPFVAYQKGIKPMIQVPQGLYSHYDLYSTLLDYTHVKVPNNPQSPGRSFAHLLRGEQEETDRNDIYIMDEYGPVRMVRNKQYKYVHRYPYGPHELYDLNHDLAEENNLIENRDSMQIISELSQTIFSKFNQYSTPTKDASKQPVYGKGQMKKVDGPVFEGFKDDFIYVNK